MTEAASREGAGLVEERVAAAPVLSATGIEKAYRRGMWPARQTRPVLHGRTLVLRPGEVVGLVGENGSGKSTLMKFLLGALVGRPRQAARRSGWSGGADCHRRVGSRVPLRGRQVLSDSCLPRCRPPADAGWPVAGPAGYRAAADRVVLALYADRTYVATIAPEDRVDVSSIIDTSLAFDLDVGSEQSPPVLTISLALSDGTRDSRQPP